MFNRALKAKCKELTERIEKLERKLKRQKETTENLESATQFVEFSNKGSPLSQAEAFEILESKGAEHPSMQQFGPLTEEELHCHRTLVERWVDENAPSGGKP